MSSMDFIMTSPISRPKQAKKIAVKQATKSVNEYKLARREHKSEIKRLKSEIKRLKNNIKLHKLMIKQTKTAEKIEKKYGKR